MKKYAIFVLAATLALSACGNGTVGQETVGTTEAVETTTAVSETTTAAAESESETELKEDTEDQETIIYRTPLDVGIAAKYEGEWDDQGPIITADSATLIILDDGYEDLKETIEVYNEKIWQEVYTMYTEHLEYAKEDIYPEGTELMISREIEITRADSKVLSFVNAETSYLGGAHGSYYENAEVFDSETGKALALSDVVADYDAVYEYVKNSLSENYEKERFFEGYEEWLHEMFYEPDGAMSSPLEWVMTMEGIEFRFSPYVLGPWVAGTFEVELPYFGNEELFHEEYLCTVEHPIVKVKPDEEFFVDTNGDGIEDKVWFSSEWNEESYHSVLTVNRDGEKEDGSEFSSALTTDEIYGTFSEAYLMYSEEEVPYLYVEFLMDNDWKKLEIIRLAETENLHSFNNIGGVGTAVYGHYISDPGQFALYDRIDILGTYMAYKNYAVGEDGMPVSDDEMYEIVNLYFDWEYALTSKREITVMMHVDGSEEKVEEKLPKGTKFRPRRTDGETVVEMELEDGRRCDIHVERGEDEYIFYINGVSEYDCFGDVPYAG